MRRLALLSLALLAAVSAGGPATAAPMVANDPGRYAPRDDCIRLPGARDFRAALARVVARRDAAGLADLADPAIRLDFGGGAGRDTLRRTMSGPEGEARWQALARIMPLGCAVGEGELAMPALFAQDLGDLDPFDLFLATGARVPVYAGADGSGPPVGTLDWQLVRPLGSSDPRQPFQLVGLIGGDLRGYVASARLRSPVDYRLIASRRGGGWKLTTFVAGD